MVFFQSLLQEGEKNPDFLQRNAQVSILSVLNQLALFVVRSNLAALDVAAKIGWSFSNNSGGFFKGNQFQIVVHLPASMKYAPTGNTVGGDNPAGLPCRPAMLSGWNGTFKMKKRRPFVAKPK
jgi:hypothetical protein